MISREREATVVKGERQMGVMNNIYKGWVCMPSQLSLHCNLSSFGVEGAKTAFAWCTVVGRIATMENPQLF